jgi:aerobic C4-dicarboxylate transport protein
VGRLNALAGSPLLLIACLVGGGLVGWLTPAVGASFFVLSQIYLSLISFVAIPLMVIATFFGLRQTLDKPYPASRSLMILIFAIGLVFSCAVVGTAYGLIANPGHGMGMEVRSHLGSVVLGADGSAGNAEVFLFTPDSTGPLAIKHAWSDLISDNLFRSLVQGQSLGVLSCAIFFGLAFASMPKSSTGVLMGVFEAAYRAFELIIFKANLFIPVLVFGMTAHFVANTNATTLLAMSSFLQTFLGLVVLLSSLGIYIVWKNTDVSLATVLKSLKTPVLISLTSGNSAASIPDTIRAMSSKLGFSRGIVELVVPAGSLFVRAGSAVYFSVLAIFVANIYGHDLTGSDALAICFGSAMAAFASAGRNSAAVVGAGSIVLSMLNLPVEAALALFLAIDLICEGPRNLVSLLCCCVLIAFVSKGLPSERQELKVSESKPDSLPIQFAFSIKSALAAIACAAVLAGLITVAGVSVGQRLSSEASTGKSTVEKERAVIDNPATTR